MSISSSYQDIFRPSSAAEKISFVQSLIETGDLNVDLAVALLKSIHSELAQPPGSHHSRYASYARLMASLRHEMPEVYEHVVANWWELQRMDAKDVLSEEKSMEAKTSEETKQAETSDDEEVLKATFDFFEEEPDGEQTRVKDTE
jgi:hypothetical protein